MICLTTLFIHSSVGIRAFDGDQLAVDAEDDRGADLEVNVRRAAVNGRLQNPMKYFHAAQGSGSRRGTKGEKVAERLTSDGFRLPRSALTGRRQLPKRQ